MRIYLRRSMLFGCVLACIGGLAQGSARSQDVRVAIVGLVAHPSMAPDGTHLAYQKKTSGGWRIYTSKLDGTGAHAITNGPGDDVEPCWRSDGKLIVFASNRGGKWDLYRISPAGTGLAQVTHGAEARNPQWSPRPFGLLMPSDISRRTVVNRPKSAVSPTELKLLELMAKTPGDWGEYRDRFDVHPQAQYYKLLCVEGVNDARRMVTMREDGSHRQVLETGIPGSNLSPTWNQTADAIAFVAHQGAGDAIYRADYPTETDQNEGAGKPNFGIDRAAFKKSVQRLGIVGQHGVEIAWTPSGEYIAAAVGRTLRLLPKPGAGLHPILIPTRAPAAPWGFTWLPNAKTALLTVVGPTGPTLEEVRSTDPLTDITNITDFNEIAAHDRTYLAKNSFVAGGSPSTQMFHIYEGTDYENLPVFITSDSLFHLHHLLFDYLLRTVEAERLMPTTLQLVEHYLKSSLSQAAEAHSPSLAQDARANAAYFAVAARLALGDVQTGAAAQAPAAGDDPLAADRAAWRTRQDRQDRALLEKWTADLRQTLAGLPAEIHAAADAEINLVKQHRGVDESPIFGGSLTGVNQPDKPLMDTRIDYSDFIPRGHYTRSEMLRRYFLVTRWLSAGPFRRDTDLTRRALLLVAAADAPTLASWQKVEDVVKEFVGAPDDQDLQAYIGIAREVYGGAPQLADLADDAKLSAFLDRVQKLPLPKIAPSKGPSFRFMPQPATADAEMMQGMVYNGKAPGVGTENQPRYFALGLDVMAILGSERAYELLRNTSFQSGLFDFSLKETEYAHYDEQLAALRARFAEWSASDWTRNLYTRTLYALMPLLTPHHQDAPVFAQNVAWTDKSLNTALATWTELKHDTLPKQPVAIEAGGEGGLTETPLFDEPVGFVEPEPEVYHRLSELARAERLALASTGNLSPGLGQRLDTFAALVDMIQKLEQKQRSGEKFTPEEQEQLRFFGAFQEHLTLITDEGEQRSLEGSDMAIVADVSSAFSTRLKRLMALEEGVGHALPIYVAVERGGHRELACGAIFTYYEFAHPAEDRLTDEKWRALLHTPSKPASPAWTKSFISRIEEGNG